MLPTVLSGQQVFEKALRADTLNENAEGGVSVFYEDDKFIIGGRYINRDTEIDYDSSFIATFDKYGNFLHSVKAASDSTQYSFYNMDVGVIDSFALNLYVSTNPNHGEDEDYSTPFISYLNLESYQTNEVYLKIGDIPFTPRGMLISNDVMYIRGNTEPDSLNQNHGIIAKFPINITEWNDTLFTEDYLLIDGEGVFDEVSGIIGLNEEFLAIIFKEYSGGLLPANNLCIVDQALSELIWQENYTETGVFSYQNLVESKIEEKVFYVTGHEALDRMIMKIDANQETEWQKFYPIDEVDICFGVGIFEDEYGNLFMAGEFTSQWNYEPKYAFLSKFNSEGELLWDRFYPTLGGGDGYIYDAIATPDGGFALVGTTYFPAPRRGDIWLIKTDSLGNTALPLSIFSEQNEYAITLGDSLILNPIPYGGAITEGIIEFGWQGASEYLEEGINGEFESMFYGNDLGVYELIFSITDSVGTSANIAYTITVYDPTSNTTAINKNQWKTYPNPANETIFFENENSNLQATHIQVFDIAGREYASFNAQNQSSLDVSTWQNGVYVYHIFDGEKLLFEGRFLVWH